MNKEGGARSRPDRLEANGGLSSEPTAGDSIANDDEYRARRDLETTTTNPPSIPDGGTQAWLQVFGSFFLFFNSWGVLNAFGVYQTYYASSFLASSGESAISWIGSLQAFLLLAVGTAVGPLFDAGYFRQILLVGTVLIVFGHMMLSLCHEYWQVLLAQGFCIGLGPGCLFVPSVAILPQYFKRHLALSVGIAAAGSSLGGVLYPIVLRRMILQVGFGWAIRTMGFIVLGTLVIPNTVMSVRSLPPQRRKMIDWESFRDVPFVLISFGCFLGFMGLFIPFFYIEGFAIRRGYTDVELGFYLISIMNAASTFGRLLPNMLADKIGPFNVFIPAALLSGALTLSTIAVHDRAGVITVATLFGFTSGAFVSVPPTIMVRITENPRRIGTRLGMAFGLTSIGVLVGAPVGGQILAHAGYNGVWIFGGVVLVAGGLVTLASRIAFGGWKPILVL